MQYYFGKKKVRYIRHKGHVLACYAGVDQQRCESADKTSPARRGVCEILGMEIDKF